MATPLSALEQAILEVRDSGHSLMESSFPLQVFDLDVKRSRRTCATKWVQVGERGHATFKVVGMVKEEISPHGWAGSKQTVRALSLF